MSGKSLIRSRPSEARIIGVAKERKAGILAADPYRGHKLCLAIFYDRRRKHGGVKVGVVFEDPQTVRLARRFLQRLVPQNTARLDA